MKTISTSRRFLAASLFALVGLCAVGCGGGDEETAPAVPSGATDNGGETPSGGGGSEPGSPGTSTSTPTPATDGPSVVSTLPANGAKGVKADAKIVVKFDRAMDAASVIAAYSSADLPADKATFAWNPAGDELTITPLEPLAYAQGAADVLAKAYAIDISTAAKDTAGRPLVQGHALSFVTARRIIVSMPMTNDLTGRVFSTGTFVSNYITAGDLLTQAGEKESRALFTFSVSTLPEDAVVEKATLLAAVQTIKGTPDASLGGLSAEQVFFSTGSEGFAAEPVAGTTTSSVLALNEVGPTYRSADVTAMFNDDVANRLVRSDRTQYRLRYLTGLDGDGASDVVYFEKADTKLQVEYLAE